MPTVHRQVAELLEQLVLGELGDRERADLEEHLGGCAECRALEGDYRLLADRLGFRDARHPSSDQLARHAVDHGSLAATERTALDDHLAVCGRCRRERELTAAAVSAARGATVLAWPSRWVGADRGTLLRRLALAAGLILAVTLGLTAGRGGRGSEEPRLPARESVAASPDAPVTPARDLLLSSEDLERSSLVEAAGSITASAITIESTSDVTLRAGGSVMLGNGFVVSPGARLRIENGQPAQPPGVNGA